MRTSDNSLPHSPPNLASLGSIGAGNVDAARWSPLPTARNWEATMSDPIDSLSDRRTPVSLDSPFVQQTKDKIRELVAQITKFVHEPVSAPDFLQFAFPRILTAMGADGIALWAWQAQSGWKLVQARELPTELLESPEQSQDSDEQSEFGLSSTSLEPLEHAELALKQALAAEAPSSDDMIGAEGDSTLRPSTKHSALLDEVRREHQPILVPPQVNRVPSHASMNPTSHMLMIVPLALSLPDGELWLEVVQQPSGGPASQRGYLRFAAQMADVISDFLKSLRTRMLEQDQKFLTVAQQIIDQATNHNSSRSISNVLVCIRDFVKADHAILLERVSRSSWRVSAIAGLPHIDRRAPGVSALESSAPVIAELSIPYAFCRFGSEGSVASGALSMPETLDPFRKMFAIHQGIWMAPEFVAKELSLESPSLLERLLNQPEPPQNLSEQESRSFLLLLWAAPRVPPLACAEQSALLYRLGKRIVESTQARAGLRVSRLASRWIIAALGLFLALGIIAIPVPMLVEANAVLIPTQTQDVFAPIDGTIERVLIEHGQQVRAGEVLLVMQSSTLSAEWERASAALNKSEQRLIELDGRLLRERSLSSVERNMLEAERNSLSASLEYEKKGLKILQNQIDSLRIVAKSDGIVETWRMNETLRDRPVRMSQWLFSLRSPTTSWEFEARVPERYLDELLQTKETSKAYGRLVSNLQEKVELSISDPLTWRSVEPTPDLKEPAYLIRMQTTSPLDGRFAMAGASAKVAVNCGRVPLIWALGKDFFENVTMRARMWFQ